MIPHFLGPDAAIVDEVGDARPWLRLQQARIRRDLMSDPAWLRGRIVRLAGRLEEDGVSLAAVVVEPESAERLRAEMRRLERAIGAVRARMTSEPVAGLDEPGAGEAIAAE